MPESTLRKAAEGAPVTRLLMVLVASLVVIAAAAWMLVPPRVDCTTVPASTCAEIADSVWLDNYVLERPLHIVVRPRPADWDVYVGDDNPAVARYGVATWAAEVELVVGGRAIAPCYRISDERMFCHPN